MSQARRLGRGLEALLGGPREANAPGESNVGMAVLGKTGKGLLELSVYEIDSNPFQPRKDFDETELGQLADSIKEHGLLQPIVVRKVGDRYQIIAGERRLRAATKAGFEHVPAQVKEADDRQMTELAIIENLQRKDLNALEKAASFQNYLQQYGGTQEELAGRLKINRSTVANLIRLLELPESVQQAVRQGKISQGHARALLPLGDEAEQVAFVNRIERETMSVRHVEAEVRQAVKSGDSEPLAVVFPDDDASNDDRSTAGTDANLADIEEELRMAMGTKVDVRQTSSGKGRITIHFTSHDEFDRIRGYLNGSKRRRRKAA